MQPFSVSTQSALSVCLSLRSSACLSVLWSECFGFGLAQVVRSHTEVVCFARCRERGVRTMLWGQANSLCYRTIDKPNKSAATAELGAGGMQPLIDPQYESFELTLACKYCQRVWQLATFHRMPHKVFPAVDSAGCWFSKRQQLASTKPEHSPPPPPSCSVFSLNSSGKSGKTVCEKTFAAMERK